MAPPSPPGTEQHTERDNNWLPTVASLAVGTAFFALWFWLLPSWLHFRIDTAGAARWRWIAALPSVFGFAVAFRCVWDFGRTGHGTPAPMIPPKKLVVVGLYRYVRNPMYRFHHRMDRPVDRLWASKLGRHCDRLRSRARRCFVRRAPFCHAAPIWERASDTGYHKTSRLFGNTIFRNRSFAHRHKPVSTFKLSKILMRPG